MKLEQPLRNCMEFSGIITRFIPITSFSSNSSACSDLSTQLRQWQNQEDTQVSNIYPEVKKKYSELDRALSLLHGVLG